MRLRKQKITPYTIFPVNLFDDYNSVMQTSVLGGGKKLVSGICGSDDDVHVMMYHMNRKLTGDRFALIIDAETISEVSLALSMGDGWEWINSNWQFVEKGTAEYLFHLTDFVDLDLSQRCKAIFILIKSSGRYEYPDKISLNIISLRLMS